MKKTTTNELDQQTVENTAIQQQEQDKFKVTFGNYESRKSAMDELTSVKKKGFRALLIIEGTYFKIFFGEFKKDNGEKVLKNLTKQGINAELV